MDGTRLVLVRHGESRAQAEGFVGGHQGCSGLSALGVRQAEALAERLVASGELSGATALYASTMPRAVETAGYLAAAVGGHEIVQDCDLCEQHPGEGDGLTWEEFEQRYPSPPRWDPEHRRDPGGETWAEMAVRVGRGLDRLVERHPGETVVVACHGGVVMHSMIRWLDLEPITSGRRAWMNPTNTSITEWKLAPNPYLRSGLGVQLVRFNDHAHLATLA